IVSGHVACAAPVVRIEEAENQRDLYFSAPPQWLKFIMLKGYAALDGASLTVSALDLDAEEFGVSLIPETIERTTLGRRRIGDRVNLEVDSQTQTIVETVERLAESGRFSNLLPR
ncbi:MAG: riboflavin synthase, partial [Pseudomonadota bacterium]